MKDKILEIKTRAEKILSEWNFPNEHFIEVTGALMVCDELLEAIEEHPKTDPLQGEDKEIDYDSINVKDPVGKISHRGTLHPVEQPTFDEKGCHNCNYHNMNHQSCNSSKICKSGSQWKSVEQPKVLDGKACNHYENTLSIEHGLDLCDNCNERKNKHIKSQPKEVEKFEELLDKFFKETPRGEINAILKKYDAMQFGLGYPSNVSKEVEGSKGAEEILENYAELACNLALHDYKNEVHCVELSDAIKSIHEYHNQFPAIDLRKELKDYGDDLGINMSYSYIDEYLLRDNKIN